MKIHRNIINKIKNMMKRTKKVSFSVWFLPKKLKALLKAGSQGVTPEPVFPNNNLISHKPSGA